MARSSADPAGPRTAMARMASSIPIYAGKPDEPRSGCPAGQGHPEGGGRNGGDAGRPLRPCRSHVQSQKTSHRVTHQIPPAVPQRIQDPGHGASHSLDAEIFRLHTRRRITPARQVDQHPVMGGPVGKQRLERGPGSCGAMQIHVRRAGRWAPTVGARLDPHRRWTKLRRNDLPPHGHFRPRGFLLNPHGHPLLLVFRTYSEPRKHQTGAGRVRSGSERRVHASRRATLTRHRRRRVSIS